MPAIQTIAITGASGHLGTAIVLEALERGLIVKAGYSGYKPDVNHPNLSWIQGDLSPEPLNNLLSGVQAVVHSAAKISVHGDKDGSVMKTNVEGTRHVIDVCKKLSLQRMVFVSSSSAVEEYPHDQTFDETRPLKTSRAPAYEYSKVLAEQLIEKQVKETDLDAVIVRPSGMFGPPDLRTSKIGEMLLDLYNGGIPALFTGGYDFVDVRDVAIGILNAVTMGRKGETYFLTGAYLQLKVVIDALHKLGGAKPPIAIPLSVVFALLPLVRLFTLITGKGDSFTKDGLSVFRDGHPNMSSKKAREELNYRTRPLEDTLIDLTKWWKQAGKIT